MIKTDNSYIATNLSLGISQIIYCDTEFFKHQFKCGLTNTYRKLIEDFPKICRKFGVYLLKFTQNLPKIYPAGTLMTHIKYFLTHHLEHHLVYQT